MPYTFLSHLLVRCLLSHILLDYYAFTLFLQPYNEVQQKKEKKNKTKTNYFLDLLSSLSQVLRHMALESRG